VKSEERKNKVGSKNTQKEERRRRRLKDEG